MMRFDMHCHTKEGSLDGKVALSDFVLQLKKRGYQGMLLSDHNSYNAYRYYRKHAAAPAFRDFVILKGIEYDTIDAGHILVILPETVRLPLMELRGLPVKLLIEIVHFFGGVLGPAHPCGEKYLSFCRSRRYRKNPDILRQFDFMETFNACESPATNRRAADLAAACGLPGFGGSDAHKADCIGLAYTDLPDFIQTETDLIRCIREKMPVTCGGTYYTHTTKDKLGLFNHVLVYSFWFYNKAAGLLRSYRRRAELSSLRHVKQ